MSAKKKQKVAATEAVPVHEDASSFPTLHRDHADNLFDVMGMLYKPHPWHGVSPGENCPEMVTAYIECVPGEGIKYEVDKPTGYLKVDRPHKFSSLCPTIYGFLPQTYCGKEVAARCMEKNPKFKDIEGDGDPIDICVLSTRAIQHGDLILNCRPIGGFRMVDDNEADDKIIAVLEGDPLMNDWRDIKDMSSSMLDLLRHYFLTYKQSPDSSLKKVIIPEVYGRDEAHEMIRRSMKDYNTKFKSLKKDFAKTIMNSLKRELAASLLSDGK